MVVITLDIAGDQVEASGMVPGLVEDGGVCTLTLTQGSTSRTVSGGTAAAQESTYCSLLTYPVQELGGGTWEATLTYASEKSYGVSDAASVVVP